MSIPVVRAVPGSAFQYEVQDRRVCGIGRDGKTLYSVNESTLAVERSADAGRTWSATNITADEYHRVLVAFSDSGVVMWRWSSGAPGEVYFAADGVTFTEVLTSVTDLGRPLSRGYDAYNDVVSFAEYSNDAGANKRIYNSTDGGQTWTEALDATADIGHFHSLDRISAFELIATAGDSDTETGWYLSRDNGASWTRLDGTQDQVYRTLGLHTALNAGRYGTNSVRSKFLWATDAASRSGIYTCEWGEWKYPRLLIPVPALHYATAGAGNEVMFGFIADKDSTQSGRKQGFVMYTKDAGETWQEDHAWELDESEASQGGVQELFGPDHYGRYYITTYSEAGFAGEFRSWIAIPTGYYAGNLKSQPHPAPKTLAFRYATLTVGATSTSFLTNVELGAYINASRERIKRISIAVAPDSSHSHRVRLRPYLSDGMTFDSRDTTFVAPTDTSLLALEDAGIRSSGWHDIHWPVFGMDLTNNDAAQHTYEVELTIERY